METAFGLHMIGRIVRPAMNVDGPIPLGKVTGEAPGTGVDQSTTSSYAHCGICTVKVFRLSLWTGAGEAGGLLSLMARLSKAVRARTHGK